MIGDLNKAIMVCNLKTGSAYGCAPEYVGMDNFFTADFANLRN